MKLKKATDEHCLTRIIAFLLSVGKVIKRLTQSVQRAGALLGVRGSREKYIIRLKEFVADKCRMDALERG